jgi:hypothetical protein
MYRKGCGRKRFSLIYEIISRNLTGATGRNHAGPQNTRCSGRHSNPVSSEYKSECYHLIQLAWYNSNVQFIFPMHAVKAYRGSKGILPLILNLCVRWRWEVSFNPPTPPHPTCASRRQTTEPADCGKVEIMWGRYDAKFRWNPFIRIANVSSDFLHIYTNITKMCQLTSPCLHVHCSLRLKLQFRVKRLGSTLRSTEECSCVTGSLIHRVIHWASALEGAGVRLSRTSPLNHLVRGQDCNPCVRFVRGCLRLAGFSRHWSEPELDFKTSSYRAVNTLRLCYRN